MRRGFTLIEMMIVVAIVGILAAIAIPNFMMIQVKSKRAELPSNLDMIKKVELAYDATFDGYVSLPKEPRDDAALDKQPVAWGSYAEWESVGYSPDGVVRGNYEVVAISGTNPAFTATGHSDVDDDGSLAEYTLTELSNATVTPAALHYY